MLNIFSKKIIILLVAASGIFVQSIPSGMMKRLMNWKSAPNMQNILAPITAAGRFPLTEFKLFFQIFRLKKLNKFFKILDPIGNIVALPVSSWMKCTFHPQTLCFSQLLYNFTRSFVALPLR